MPNQIYPPECLMEVFRYLFPTIDFSRVSFYDGIPFPLNVGQNGITIPSPPWNIHVYLKEGFYQPCDTESFLVMAHELVHVLQIEDSVLSGYIPGWWIFKYIGAFVGGTFSFASGCDNAFENEAYTYSNGCGPPLGASGGDLRNCLAKAGLGAPCDCSKLPLYGESTQAGMTFLDVLKKSCPDIVKTKANASSKGSLANPITFLIALFVGLLAPAGLANAGGLWGTLIGGIIGGILGGIFGFIGCAIFGGGLAALCATGGAILGSLLGGLIGGILGSLIDWIVSGVAGWFSGVGKISLVFSTDNGVTFPDANKTSFEESSEPPALASNGTNIYVGWTGTDNHLNVLQAPPAQKKTLSDQSDNDAGPALAVAFNNVRLLWQDEDNHLHIMASPTGAPNFGGKVDLGQSVASSACPALALGQDFVGTPLLYLAWIDDNDNRINVRMAYDGVTFGSSHYAGHSSNGSGTPAIAFGNGRLYLAWVDDDDNHVHVMSFAPTDGPGLQTVSDVQLNERSSDDAGPALAFGNGRLFLAWTDDNDHLQFMFSDDPDGQRWGPRLQLGSSSDNAGPAVAYIAGQTVAVAWIDK